MSDIWIFNHIRFLIYYSVICEGKRVGQFAKQNARTEKTAEVKIVQGVLYGKNSA